jgi:hypothetical protein
MAKNGLAAGNQQMVGNQSGCCGHSGPYSSLRSLRRIGPVSAALRRSLNVRRPRSHSKSDVVSMIRGNAYIACPIHKDRDHFVKSAILVWWALCLRHATPLHARLKNQSTSCIGIVAMGSVGKI